MRSGLCSSSASRIVRRPNQGSARLRLWRRRHPGPRLLPLRQHRIQRPGALRSQRRLRSLNYCARASDADEYAFALGALAHYASDIAGHPAVNQSVAIQYPKLRAKYGNSVRYAQDNTAHLKTEFGFDMVQVAKNRYASQQYHDFIGFQVSKPLLERVFPVVYGVELKDVLPHEDLAVGSYRFSVSRLIPEMTQVALQTHKKDMMRETPDFREAEVPLPPLSLRL